MINIHNELHSLDLNESNSLVIGSGILQALNIRNAQDLDIIVNESTFKSLQSEESLIYEPRRIVGDRLYKNDVEIFTQWDILEKRYSFTDLFSHSVVIDEARYLSLDFIEKVKKQLNRDKDKKDLILIEKYKNNLAP